MVNHFCNILGYGSKNMFSVQFSPDAGEWSKAISSVTGLNTVYNLVEPGDFLSAKNPESPLFRCHREG